MISTKPTRIKLTLSDLEELEAERKTWQLKDNVVAQRAAQNQQSKEQEEEDKHQKEVHKRIGLTK